MTTSANAWLGLGAAVFLVLACSTAQTSRVAVQGGATATTPSSPVQTPVVPTPSVHLPTSGMAARETTVCGNGKLESPEECDDGNVNSGDGCSSKCRAEAVQIAAGADHYCVITSLGTMKCWGWNKYGQLGYGDTLNRGDSVASRGVALTPVNVDANRKAMSLALGDAFSCALLDDGNVKCWGAGIGLWFAKNSNDHRGDAPGEMGDALPVFPVKAGLRISDLSAAFGNACITFSDGTYTCWGKRDLDRTKQVKLDGKAQLVRAADLHSCALMTDGRVKCWGGVCIGTNRQLPLDAPQVIRFAPKQKVKQLALGSNHTCALLADGGVTCWGSGERGQLGRVPTPNDCKGEPGDPWVGPSLCANQPPHIPLVLGDKAIAVAVGPVGNFSCALLENGSVRCWGNNDNGQLGIGQVSQTRYNDLEALPNPNTTVPSQPVNLGVGRKAKAIAVQSGGVCALLTDGCVKCWGLNNVGQLGYGDTVNRSAPPDQCVDY